MSGGLSLTSLLVAAVICLPAGWQSLHGELPLPVLAERYVVVAVVCAVVSAMLSRIAGGGSRDGAA